MSFLTKRLAEREETIFDDFHDTIGCLFRAHITRVSHLHVLFYDRQHTVNENKRVLKVNSIYMYIHNINYQVSLKLYV